MSVNGELIEAIFDAIDEKISALGVLTYDYLETIKPVLGGTTVLLAGITDNLAQAKINDRLSNTSLDIFVHTKDIKTILGRLRLFMSKIPDDDIVLTKPSFMKDSAFQLFGINMRYFFDMSGISLNLPMFINLYSVSDNRELTEATGISGYNVLTSYIRLDGDPDKLKFSTYDSEKIKNRVAHMSMLASQNYFNTYFSHHPNKYNRGDDFETKQSEFELGLLNFEVKRGSHTIDMDHMGMSQIFTEEGNRRFILGGIADFTKYFMKVGYGKYTDKLVLGISVNKPLERKVDSHMDTYFESYDYYSDSIENLYKFYKECINHSLSTSAPPFSHNGVTYQITSKDPGVDPSSLKRWPVVEIGTARYVNVKYSFDVNVYKDILATEGVNYSLTDVPLPDGMRQEAYYRKCFYNHCMYWTSLYRGYYRKKWDWYPKNPDYQNQTRDIMSEIEEFCTKNYKESIEVDKEVDMGVSISPIIEDFVDEDGYLNVKEIVEKKTYAIVYIRDSQGRLGEPIIFDKQKLIIENKKDLMQKIFYKCTDDFDGKRDPLDIGFHNIDFTTPYYWLAGGNQETVIRYSDLQSIMWGSGNEFSANAFIFEKEKEIHRIASLDHINVRYSEDVTGEYIDVTSGYHCNSGVRKPIYGVKLAAITEYIEIEREKEVFIPVITLDDIFEKYPEAKELYESNIPKSTKFRNAIRLDMEPQYKAKFQQSIQMQRQPLSSPPPSPQRQSSYQVLEPDNSGSDTQSVDSDAPQREIGGGGGYMSEDDEDLEPPTRRNALPPGSPGLQPTRLDFDDNESDGGHRDDRHDTDSSDDDENGIFQTKEDLINAIAEVQKEVERGFPAYSDRYGSVVQWDVSQITDMSYLFSRHDTNKFNKDISGWDVSNVTEMEGMFQGSKFNRYIGDWDVINVQNMSKMFSEFSEFNQNINDWDVKNVVFTTEMFKDAYKFKGPINKWRFENIEIMDGMFSHSAYNNDNGNLEEWGEQIKRLKPDMDYMFENSEMENRNTIPDWYEEGDSDDAERSDSVLEPIVVDDSTEGAENFT